MAPLKKLLFLTTTFITLSASAYHTITLRPGESIRTIEERTNAIVDVVCQGSTEPYPPYPPPYPPQPPRSQVNFYHSDSCSSELIGMIELGGTCAKFRDVNASVWGISVNGRCFDVSDTNINFACESMKGLNDPRHVKLFHSDSCSNELVAAIGFDTSCEALAQMGGSKSVWGIEINGRCQDIQDISFLDACKRFHP